MASREVIHSFAGSLWERRHVSVRALRSRVDGSAIASQAFLPCCRRAERRWSNRLVLVVEAGAVSASYPRSGDRVFWHRSGWRPALSNRCTSRLPENFSRKRRVAEYLLTREPCEAQASSRSLGSNGDPVHQPALARDLNLFGITERRATVTRRSSTQDGLRSDPTRRVGSRLLRYRRSNHQGMSL